MTETKYMEERQSLVFQTERLKVAEEMAKTKAQVQILGETCDEIVGRKKDVTAMKSLFHSTFNHQNDTGRSATVPVDAKSSMVMWILVHQGRSILDILRISRQAFPVRRIGMNGRSS